MQADRAASTRDRTLPRAVPDPQPRLGTSQQRAHQSKRLRRRLWRRSVTTPDVTGELIKALIVDFDNKQRAIDRKVLAPASRRTIPPSHDKRACSSRCNSMNPRPCVSRCHKSDARS